MKAKKRKPFISKLTGKSYKYYADMDLHDELKVKELTAKKINLKPIKK